MTFPFSLLKEVRILLDNEFRRIYLVSLVFVLSSSLDLIGLGLIGAYIALISNPDGFRELLLLDSFNDFLSRFSDQELLILFGLALLIIFFVRLLAILLSNYIIYKFSADQMVNMQERMMSIYLNQDYESFIQRNSSEYVAAVSGYVRRYKDVLQSMLKIFSDVLVCIAVISALAVVSIETLSILIFLFLTMFMLFNKFLYSKVLRYGEEFNLGNRLMIKGISEGVSGIKEIRVLGKEDFFKTSFSRGIKTMAEMEIKQSLIQITPKSLLELLMVVFVVIAVFLNIYQQNDLDQVFTILGVFAVGAVRLVPIVTQLFSSINIIKFGRSSVSNLYQDIQNFETGEIETIESKSVILQKQDFLDLDIKNLSYSYPNSDEKALKNISLKINKGDFVGFVGPSGAGKTTLVDVLLGLLNPQTGTIKLNGKDIFSQIHIWRSLVAYLPQEIFLIDDSLSKNIALDDNTDHLLDGRFNEVIRKSKLDDFIENLPEGLNTRMGERGVRLSGGQRQRVAIARALFHEREVLILDEATSSLDMQTEEEIVNQMQKFKGEKTVITIAHRISTLKYCDCLYKLEKGIISGPYSYDEYLQILDD
tara:strand:+ start:3719 stop:5494 length:1776 start_codon:yes stop_codon:yes gene_type:complete